MSCPSYTVPGAMQVLGVADQTIRHMLAAQQFQEAGRKPKGARLLGCYLATLHKKILHGLFS